MYIAYICQEFHFPEGRFQWRWKRQRLRSDDWSTYIIFVANVCGWKSVILVCAPFLTSRCETLTCLPISMTTGDRSLALWSITLIYPFVFVTYKTHIMQQGTEMNYASGRVNRKMNTCRTYQSKTKLACIGLHGNLQNQYKVTQTYTESTCQDNKERLL